MQHVLWAAVLAVFCAPVVRAQSLAGDWLGTIQTGPVGLRLVLRVKGSAGAFTATLYSPDQGASGIPVSSISLEGPTVKFASEAVHGSYEGKLSADGNRIEGTWTQGEGVPLTFARSVASDIAGDWSGTLDTGAQKLSLVFHIAGTAAGLTASLDSVTQGAKGIPISAVMRNGSRIVMESEAVHGRFEGTISKDLSTIDGTWSQGAPLPLLLKRGRPPAPNRPQNPKKPYPYKEEDVKYRNPAAGITLAGTLTIPQGKGPFRAVLLISGSGPNDRDEELMDHRPFLVLADYLTRRGIEVLRSDKRGVGESGGRYSTATTADFASDAGAGVAFLKSRAEVDPKKIGLIGHSEGGMIAPMVAAHDDSVAFIVMMAGAGVRGDVTLPEQKRLLMEAAGVPHATAARAAEQEAAIIAMVEKEPDPAALRKEVTQRFGASDEVKEMVDALLTPWMRYFLTYDPAVALREVHCPVLALNGSKDLQVPAALNLPAIGRALEEGGNRYFEAVEMPGLNHLFQPAKTGGADEYQQIEITIAPEALEKIGAWILQR